MVLAALLAVGQFTTDARTAKSTKVDDGGSGPYKAVIVEDDALPGYSIFRPEDLKSAAAVEGPLPIILFGNGGCAHSSTGFYGFLTEIASYGYVIISNGVWRESQPRMTGDRPMPMTTPPAGERPQAQQMPRQGAPAMAAPASDPSQSADALEILAKLDWFEAQNADPSSEYYAAVNPSCAIAMGQSCGGLQAIIMGTAGDARVRTVVPLNSGTFEQTFVVEKAALDRLTVPIAYIIGGESDIAYAQAVDDFQKIDKVPVAIANLPVGHGGTYREPNGGQFAEMALLWIEWQIRGRGEGEKVFRYCQVPENLKGWTVHARNFNKRETFDLPHPDATGEENISRNPFGEASNITGVKYPSMTVSLADPDKANGSAVLLFPGGGLMALSWESDFIEMANWLNARGIAAIGVKYRTRDMSSFRRPAGPAPQPAQAGPRPAAPARDFSKITGFGVLEHANANPGTPQPGVEDPSIAAAAEDCLNALRLVRSHAAEWGLDPARVGVMGFSAGGGVELAGLLRASAEERPSFVVSVYGPALEDMYVEPDYPPLFIAVHADHPNVAAGCLALFMEWKKAGVDAEMHIYGEGTGGLFGGGGSSPDRNLISGSWLEPFYSWMHVKHFLEPQSE
jgi:acetyl esterase/lipase